MLLQLSVSQARQIVTIVVLVCTQILLSLCPETQFLPRIWLWPEVFPAIEFQTRRERVRFAFQRCIGCGGVGSQSAQVGDELAEFVGCGGAAWRGGVCFAGGGLGLGFGLRIWRRVFGVEARSAGYVPLLPLSWQLRRDA